LGIRAKLISQLRYACNCQAANQYYSPGKSNGAFHCCSIVNIEYQTCSWVCYFVIPIAMECTTPSIK
jgi:hypothetical protein